MKSLLRMLKLPREIIKGTNIQNNRFLVSCYEALMKFVSMGSEDVKVNFRGMVLLAEGGDITLLPTLLDGSFERYEIDWFIAFMTNSKGPVLFIDIGANIGVYTVKALQTRSDTKVVSVEPDSRNLRRLKDNTRAFENQERFQIIECAVGFVDTEHSGEAKRYFLNNTYGGTSRLVGSCEDTLLGNLTAVEMVTLDHLLTSNLQPEFREILIKIDVEGFEPEVLKSGMSSINEFKPTLLVEYTNSPTRNQLAGWSEEILDFLFDCYPNVYIQSFKKPIRVTNQNDLAKFARNEVINLVFSKNDFLEKTS